MAVRKLKDLEPIPDVYLDDLLQRLFIGQRARAGDMAAGFIASLETLSRAFRQRYIAEHREALVADTDPRKKGRAMKRR
jgi:hypothetical protein